MPLRRTHYTGYDGKRMAMRVWAPDGEPDGVVLGLHGLGSHSGLISTIGEYYEQNGIAFYAPDLRGFGEYDGVRGHIERFDEFLDDVDALVEQVQGEHPERPLFLFGHSFGGLIAVSYVTRRRADRLAGLVLSSPGLSERLKVSRPLKALVGLLSRVCPTKLVDNGLDLDLVFKSKEAVRRNREDPLRFDMVTTRFAAEGFRAVAEAVTMGPEIVLPVLMQQPLDDRIVVPEENIRFFESIASADKTLRTYEGAYHDPYDDPEGPAVLADAVAWVREHL